MRTDGRSGRADAQVTQKYIPLTSSVDNKQAKSNGNIDKKNQQFIVNQNNWIIMPSIIAWNKVFIIWNRSGVIYAKCNKKKVCLLSMHNGTIITFWTNCTWLTQNELKNLDYYLLRRHSQRKMKLKYQNVIIITLLQNVLQHRLICYNCVAVIVLCLFLAVSWLGCDISWPYSLLYASYNYPELCAKFHI